MPYRNAIPEDIHEKEIEDPDDANKKIKKPYFKEYELPTNFKI